MKDFQKIDWKLYNRPPYYQQWLCKEDTLKLATFGDRGLGDIDDQVLSLKDQWDSDTVKGSLLDRIGKILQEARNGSDDELYRKYIRLRILLNTADGSLNNIIQIMKFIYDAEVIHIVPDYPAGLIIEHQGELTPGLDFNEIIKQVVPAGVAYSTKEIFDFIEEMFSTDMQRIQVRYNPKEEFEGRIYHNRRILHDGHTVLPTELKYSFHNGINYHNGNTRYNGNYEAEATSYIKPPIRRQSGYLDPLSLGLGLFLKDFQFSQLFHNGSIKRKMRAAHNSEFLHNGITNRMPVSRHNGRSEYSISDYMSVFKVKHPVTEYFPASEQSLVNLSVYDTDEFRKSYKRNGIYKHNKKIFHSEWTIDVLLLLQRLSQQDNALGTLYHNRSFIRNGVENHSVRGNNFAYENNPITIGVPVIENMPSTEDQGMNIVNDTTEFVSKSYMYNHKYTHNGAILRNSFTNDKMKMQMNLDPIAESHLGRMLRNGCIKRSGEEIHHSQRIAYDTFSAGIRYHHDHNGSYFRNNGIKHNAGVLFPLEDIA